MDPSAFLALALTCAPSIHVDTSRALVSIESAFNPWAIGVVGGALTRQPRHQTEALATARALEHDGWDFSVGLGQINRRNFPRLGLTLDSAFDPCSNLAAMQVVLAECFDRAGAPTRSASQATLRRALSCYYSGNFATGFKHGYVRKVVAASNRLRSLDSPAPRPTSAASKEPS
jgi:type IV secretion system protein VirB1